MKTAVVILNWNGRSFLEKFLPGLVESLEGFDAEVIVADNASADGSPEWLSQAHPAIRQIRFDENFGFTGGYNRAFDILASDEKEAPEYFLLINSDVEVAPDWFYPLEEWMDIHSDCGACAPKLLSHAARDEFEYAGAAGGMLDLFCFPFCRGRIMKMTQKDEGQYDSPCDVLWGSGACLMVRSATWKELGGLDGRFFAHMEEIDLCWRMRLSGWGVSYVPRSRVWHVGGGSLPQDSPWKLRLNYRNNLLMMRNNLAATYVIGDFFDLLSVNAPEAAVSTDDFANCLEVYNEMPETIRRTIISTCVSDGTRTAARRIRMRRRIDRCAALSYLLKGRKDYFSAVRTAHAEYRKLRSDIDRAALEKMLLDDIASGCPRARKLLDIDLERPKSSRVRFTGIVEAPVIALALALRKGVFTAVDELTR